MEEPEGNKHGQFDDRITRILQSSKLCVYTCVCVCDTRMRVCVCLYVFVLGHQRYIKLNQSNCNLHCVRDSRLKLTDESIVWKVHSIEH